MVSRVARHLLEMLGGIVAVAIWPVTVFSQSSADRLRADDDRERIAEEIGAAHAEGGPQSADLIAPLTELAELYKGEGQHALATAALEQARHLVRANYGLHTLDQAPLLEQALKNQQALGNFAMVQALEEELYVLANRHPDDSRAAAIHRGIGERKMNLLERFVAEEYPPELYPEVGLFAFGTEGVVMELASEAQIHYADAAAVLLRGGLQSNDELRDIEMEIVRAADLFRERNRLDLRSIRLGTRRMDFAGLGGHRAYGVGESRYVSATEELQMRTDTLWDLTGSETPEDSELRRARVRKMNTRYELGRESYRRLVAYAEGASARSPADGPAWENRLDAYLQLADWDLLYSANGVALDEYAQVHEMLKTNGDIALPLIAEIFAPPIPIVLPTFQPNPLQTLPSDRYIDVAFQITRYGESRRIEIVGAEPSVPDATKDELVNVIRTNRFRPRVTDGELGHASPVIVRYYLKE